MAPLTNFEELKRLDFTENGSDPLGVHDLHKPIIIDLTILCSSKPAHTVARLAESIVVCLE